jgi:starch phosphorylase
VPAEWLRMAKRSIVRLGPQVESTRMLREYVERLYEPAAVDAERMVDDDFAPTRSLVRWTRHLDRAWPSVTIASTSIERRAGESGAHAITAQVLLGELDPSDVSVQAIYGEVDFDDDLVEPSTVEMTLAGDGDHYGWQRFAVDIEVPRAGNFGYTVRVVPKHPDVEDYTTLGHITWAPAS